MTDAHNVPGRQGSAPSSTSSSLLAGLKANDPDAWRRMAVLYAPLVYRWCRQRHLQPADAEDVVQEVFRTVLARIGDFHKERPEDTFRGWLWTITRHKLGDHFRRRAAQPEAAGGAGTDQRVAQLAAVEPVEVAGETAAGEYGGLYRRAFDLIRGEFEESSWQAFLQVVLEDRRPRDVAADLGLSVNAVYLAKSRILRRLREELGDVAQP